ncbi:IS3 family transposase [Persicitalea sp.]|uniref:IS3 family transposase n=1 Tax=Persicitalea sp. TaxID=3100273 RepID=UPI00359408CE
MARREEEELLVERVFGEHKRRYGSRRITAELCEQGYAIGRHQVRSLMRNSGLRPIQPKSFVRQRPTVAHDRQHTRKGLLWDGPCRPIHC